ncbi:acetyl-CoA hydrolase/transferase family protein [Tepidiforma thermophila]|uniref:Acetyl-CoA hydrolase n=1 Tax=Tepidiforma thermophila (strain KCTC 52669 / CGMCC 1.13589 / G233) TaxID=2761530 RepID=A0A2A9HCM3_TEPT2|nr:acetyl-CoA hydrolase/transferase C-terminal domain-containing protein [Tepidiforma thermophila]PFG72870.1 acetyl-CoA hydrolase [Tepidiforma thermophila]
MRIVGLDEAVGVVQHGDRVYVHGGVCTPRVLVEGLVAIRQDLRDVEIVHLHTDAPAPYAEPGMEERFRHNALFIGPNVRQAVQEGRADYTPIFLSDIPRQFEPGGALPLDVAFIQVSPPDREGRCTLGVSVDCAMAAAIHARTVVAQVNPRMPRTFGHSLDASFIDLAIEVDEQLPQVVLEEPGPEAMDIGRHVAELVADGSTLQMGIGTIPSAVLRHLTGHRDLGVHTEMFTQALLPLIRAGVVNGARKTRDRGKVVSAFAVGNQELYDFVDWNPEVEFHPVDYTNDVDVIASQDRMVAINSALSVDLTGQVVADSIGPRFYSGIGGQVDFIRGAARAKHGVPIIALPSTAKGGTVSRICPELAAGSGVVTTRGDVHWVVTEYGARNLHGRTIRERARMLIEIAHPKFREELARRATELGYLGRHEHIPGL